jgi:transposase-like protein
LCSFSPLYQISFLFCNRALETAGQSPKQVTTDGHRSYPRAIRETLGGDILHRTNHYLNNVLEQDHRGIKQRYYPMRGFGNVTSAPRFCRAFDEVRQFFRCRTTLGQSLSLAQQRDLFRQRLKNFNGMILRASEKETIVR